MAEVRRERMKYLYAPMVEKAVDGAEDKPIVRYIFTSDEMDEAGDVITREATEKAVEEWRQWRNIRLQHDPSKPIGKAIRIGSGDGLEWNQMDVRIDDPNVIPLVSGDDPVLAGASVGIIVNDFEPNENEEAIARSPWGDPWIITDYTFVEISLVDHPMNYDAKRVGEVTEGRGKVLFRRRDLLPPPIKEKTVSGDTDLPLADRDREWDGDAAVSRVREWAGGPDKEDIDWSKYKRAFFWYDSEDSENFTSYKLPFADVINGTLTAVPRGIFAVAGVLSGARGGVDIPESDIDGIKSKVEKYYARMRDEFDDDSIVPPWENEGEEGLPEPEAEEEDMEEAEETKLLDKEGEETVVEESLPDEAPQEETPEPEEQKDADPVMEKLGSIAYMLGIMAERMEAIYKAVIPQEVEPDASEDEDVDTSEQAMDVDLEKLVDSVNRIYERLFSEEAEDEEVEEHEDDTDKLQDIVRAAVDEAINERLKLKARKSVAFHVEESEGSEDNEEDKAADPRERLYRKVRQAWTRSRTME